jgi:uncharacterized RDD family membrane protein YckC
LAPDLARIIPSRLEPARDLPGRKRREPSWRDEVKQRVQERRRQRLGGGELPLFVDRVPELDVSLDGEADLPLDPAGLFSTAAPVTPAPAASLGVEDSGPLSVEPEERPRLVWSTPPPAKIAAAEPPSASRWSLGDEDEPEAAADGDEEPSPADASRWVLNTPEPAAPAAAPAPAPRLRIERPMVEGSMFASALLDEEPEDDAEVAPLESPAPWGERAQAALFDLGILAALWGIVVYFASRAAGSVAALRPVWPPLAGYLAFLGLLYAVYFTGTCGRTIGKIVCGLRVVDVAGRAPGYGIAFVRTVLGTIGIVAGMVALIPIFFDPARRALHDRILRTRVVKY